MRSSPHRSWTVPLAAAFPLAAVLGLAATPALAAPGFGQHPGDGRPGHGALSAQTILAGSSLTHTFTAAGSVPTSEPLSNPDDITQLGQDIFVGFQNGVGPQGQPSSSGNLDSTVVELTTSGQCSPSGTSRARRTG
jgi:hypothetical protein